MSYKSILPRKPNKQQATELGQKPFAFNSTRTGTQFRKISMTLRERTKK